MGFDAELKYFNEVLRGTAYNRTQRDLEDVILVLRNGIYVIGDLKAGEERKLQDVEKPFLEMQDNLDYPVPPPPGQTALPWERESYLVLSGRTELERRRRSRL